MSPVRVGLLLVVMGATLPDRALAQQDRAAGPVVLEQEVFRDFIARPVLRVVDASGSAIRLEPQAQYRELPLGFAEGYYLLMLGPKDAGGEIRLLRVQVRDIGPEGVLTLAAGNAHGLKAGDAVNLLRPARATTAQMRSLPEVIPIVASSSGAEEARLTVARAKSVNHLKQIGLAMHNFLSATDQFPPAVVFGPDGKPWHSWRVLILPYLGQLELYNAYDFGQPWDSERNLKLLDRMPEIYGDPAYGDNKAHLTHYAAPVGQGAAFKPAGTKMDDAQNLILGKGGTRIADFTDGTSNSILVVPVSPDRKIPWTKPEDITVGANFAGIGKPGGIATPYRVRNQPDGAGVAPVAFADGSVRSLIETINPQTLDALLTISGGEVISFDALDSDPMPPPRHAKLRLRIEGANASATIE
jgi:hypothetical protein